MSAPRRKNILIVRPTMGQGGADRVTLTLLQHLDRKQYDLSLLLMRKEGPHLAGIPTDVKVYDAQVKNLWFFLPTLMKWIRRLKPDMIFSTCGGANMPLSIAAFFSPSRKWKAILSERNIIFPPGKNKFKRTLMLIAKGFFYRFADVLTSVSDGVREDMNRKLHIPVDRIKLVHNPVIDDQLFEHAKTAVVHPWFSDPRQKPVILHVGRFVHQKDHATLIEAFETVKKKLDCKLFLLGDGPLRESIEEMVRDRNLSDSVYFAGFDPNPFKYMSKCDVFVLSSLHEGMPGVLIQAMACSAPVVSTDCPSGPSEIIDKPGVNGLLVPVKDPSALARAIISVLSDKSLQQILKSNGLSSVKRFLISEAMHTYEQAINA
jgi:glycosyltransferase involved in cell wall biosynthesis